MLDKSPRVLTPEQRLLFTTIPENLSMAEMSRYYTLHPEDVAFISRHRSAHNKLGVALQICTLRFP
ncbi:MAG: DUF4158 domain-containing protein [Planctomycetes bacterium]|nr:DUF4158 domain-containing protein [Planctomycetota bacterium]